MILEASFGQPAFGRRRAARLRWTDSNLAARRKSDPAKMAIAAPLRRELGQGLGFRTMMRARS
jgi:hypothetical protein